ncbi:RCC1 domain-containing protein [Cohnella mopanensis]|uniref:RCC1 domain-containing protein n=1 Tax=Cohnella mopanensis TaxID=2911966 RepID=UPI001EF89E3C|nr:stalk domain-containing protein [Cohnella mopanensis]
MEINNGWSWKHVLALIAAILVGLGFPFSSAKGSDLSTQANRLFSNVKQVEAGQFGGFAVKEDGSAWAWGTYKDANVYYATTSAFSPIKLSIDNVKQISRGDRFYLLLKKDGTVWSVGANEHGQLGNGTQNDTIVHDPVQVKGLSDIKAVSAGSYHSLAIDGTGKVWAWGGNDQGQLGIDSRENAVKPVQIDGLPSILAIEAGQKGSIALGNGGEIWSWGLKKEVTNGPDEVRKPAQIKGNGEFVAIADADDRGVALSHDGTVWTWNNYSFDKSADLLNPIQVTGLKDIISISAYSAVKSDGTVWQWQQNGKGSSYKQVQGIERAIKVSDTWQHHFALLEDGHVLSWGDNYFGNTGLGLLDQRIDSPQAIKNSIGIFVDGQATDMVTPPLIVNQVTYVPLRGIFEKLGVTVKWDVPSRSVIATKGETTIVLNSVTGQTTVNDKVIPSEQKPLTIRGSTMVPLRLIGETMGATVKWDPEAYAVNITQVKD